MKIMLLGVRIGFAALYKPEAFADGEPAYQAALIIPPKSPLVAKIEAAVAAVALEKWKTQAKADAILKKIAPDRKLMAWQKEEYSNAEGVVYDGFEGSYYLRARNEIQPLLLTAGREEVTSRGANGAPYGGCYTNTQVDIWAQDNGFGKGIRCKLLGVQFAKDGDAFAGGAKASVDDFDDLSVNEEEDENEFA